MYARAANWLFHTLASLVSIQGQSCCCPHVVYNRRIGAIRDPTCRRCNGQVVVPLDGWSKCEPVSITSSISGAISVKKGIEILWRKSLWSMVLVGTGTQWPNSSSSARTLVGSFGGMATVHCSFNHASNGDPRMDIFGSTICPDTRRGRPYQ